MWILDHVLIYVGGAVQNRAGLCTKEKIPANLFSHPSRGSQDYIMQQTTCRIIKPSFDYHALLPTQESSVFTIVYPMCVNPLNHRYNQLFIQTITQSHASKISLDSCCDWRHCTNLVWCISRPRQVCYRRAYFFVSLHYFSVLSLALPSGASV